MNNFEIDPVLKFGATLVAILLLFVLTIFLVDSIAKDSCIKNLKDKPAIEIKLVCS